jgi:phenylpropionate dioxygenase-like ring-hydroxylating dioxygenase large terminal subunit
MGGGVLRFAHPVLPARKLRDRPVRVVVDGSPFVLFRDARGCAQALADRCPHRFAPLSAGRVRSDGRLQCAYHGWHFDGEGNGVCPSQPSLGKCNATAMRVVERYGYLWLGESDVPSWKFDGYALAGAFATRFDAPLHVALDNFSEDEHTPWVHTRLGWREADADAIQFHAETYDDRTEVHYDAPQRPSWLARLLGLRAGDTFHNDWVTRFDPVHTIYKTFWRDPQTNEERASSIISPIYFVPENAQTTVLHTFVFLRHDPRLPKRLIETLATRLAMREVADDARFIETVRDTPFSMKGMRLDRYDKPLVANHRLLERIYWGTADPAKRIDPEPISAQNR